LGRARDGPGELIVRDDLRAGIEAGPPKEGQIRRGLSPRIRERGEGDRAPRDIDQRAIGVQRGEAEGAAEPAIDHAPAEPGAEAARVPLALPEITHRADPLAAELKAIVPRREAEPAAIVSSGADAERA